MKMLKNIMIVGAGMAGQLLRRDIMANHPELKVLGFVDDGFRHRRDVVGAIDDMPALVAQYKVDEIIIAIPSAAGKLIRRILLVNKDHSIPIRIVPREQEVLRNSQVSYNAVKTIQCDDFLGRPIVKIDIKKLEKYYRGKTVFVTGGAGSIGSEIVRQLLELNVRKVIVYDHSEYMVFNLDQQLREKGIASARYQLIIGTILNAARLDYALAQTKPDLLFHVAAYKHVYLMEENAAEAVATNVLGTRIVADAAVHHNVAACTFVSTDKVVNPQSIMGATKKIAEYYIQSLPPSRTKFTIVRFGNVINSQGSVLPLFQRQMRDHRYVTITHQKMERYFMSIREAAQLVIQSTARNSHGEIYILNMGELINIYEVALCLIRSLDLVPVSDVSIRVIGRRKGEKMVEELFTKKEQRHLAKTSVANVWRLKNVEKPPANIQKIIANLSLAIQHYPCEPKIKRQLKTFFPSLK